MGERSAVKWYQLDSQEIFKKFATNQRGLTSDQVAERQKKFGLNQLVQENQVDYGKLAFRQFRNPLVYILIIAGIIAFWLDHRIDALVIVIVILINTLIGFIQEVRAEFNLRALRDFLAQKTWVIRDGLRQHIPIEEITRGDIVMLSEGMQVPADLRLIKTNNLKIDESLLTGESIPVHKNTAHIDQPTPLSRRFNMAFGGTTVVAGKGLGVVVDVGKETQFSKIAHEIIATEKEDTPLGKRINNLGQLILISIILMTGLIVVVGIVRGENLLELGFTAVAAAVAAIPEGLPAVVTIALAVGVNRMAKRNAIVRELAAVETIGSINVIATDKTGTLTENKLSVRNLYLPDGKKLEFTGEGYNPQGKVKIGNKPIAGKLKKHVQQVLLVGSLVNNAELKKYDQQWKIIGDPTEGAIVVAAQKAGINVAEERRYWPRINELPFSSQYRLMATKYSEDHKYIVHVKGSIDKILSLSQKMMDSQGKIAALSSTQKNKIETLARQVAQDGYRILAIATGVSKNKSKLTIKNIPPLTFLGFVAMFDAPRKSAIEAFKKTQAAGIRTIMITGDIAETAGSVARIMGFKKSKAVLTGAQLANLSEQEFQHAVQKYNIFAEVSPTMKLKIVKAIQQENQIIAVTGDGVNDAPSLKKAHVGIAMGVGGTDIARESAQLVLVDNNFATIISAIEQGRAIFTNIQRSVWYLISSNAAELLILLGALGLAWPLAFLPSQILWINVITDSTGVIGLAVEPGHEGLKKRPHFIQKQFFDKVLMQRMILVASTMTILTLAVYGYALQSSATNNLDYARTMAFAGLAILQVANLFNAQSFEQSILKTPILKNPLLIWSAIVSVFLIVSTTLWEPLRNLFQTVQLSWQDWLLLTVVSLIIIAVVEIEKWWRA